MQKRHFSLLVLLFCFFSCKEKAKEVSNTLKQTDTVRKAIVEEPKKDSLPKADTLPEKGIFKQVKDIKYFPKTAFVNTLESDLVGKKNNIYAATMAFAWDRIREVLKDSLSIAPKYKALIALHSTKSYRGSLLKNEIDIKTKIEQDRIKVRTYFRKSLPFISDFRKDVPLTFQHKKVKAFGLGRHRNNIKVLYYKDDTEFVIQLITKDENQALIVAKGIKNTSSFASALAELDKKIDFGEKEKKIEAQRWKYKIEYEDRLAVPFLNFNIEHDDKTLLGSEFRTSSDPYTITEAYQQVAVKLDEKGAEAESEARMTVSKGLHDAIKIAEKPHPKNLIFDSPFLLIAKRKEASHPYLALWIQNTELMEME